MINKNKEYISINTVFNLSKINTTWQNNHVESAIGQQGVVDANHKREGDGKTPLGMHQIVYGYYRPDRLEKPVSLIPMYSLQSNWGWCDDPHHLAYNRLVTLPFAHSHELLWRDDSLYDIVLVTDYNLNQPVPGRGSAIFVHLGSDESISDKDNTMTPSAGCLKLRYLDMLHILRSCGSTLYWQVKQA